MDELVFIIPFVMGLCYVIIGFILMVFPPKNKNALIGYKTHSAVRSQAHWDFAQIYSSKMLIRMGALLIGTSFLLLTVDISYLSEYIILAFTAFFATYFIFHYTESELKRI